MSAPESYGRSLCAAAAERWRGPGHCKELTESQSYLLVREGVIKFLTVSNLKAGGGEAPRVCDRGVRGMRDISVADCRSAPAAEGSRWGSAGASPYRSYGRVL